MDTCAEAVLFHVNIGILDRSEKLPPLNPKTQSIRVVPCSQSTVTCPSIDTPLVHPPLLGCVLLNMLDLFVLYDNGVSGIEPVQVHKS